MNLTKTPLLDGAALRDSITSRLLGLLDVESGPSYRVPLFIQQYATPFIFGTIRQSDYEPEKAPSDTIIKSMLERYEKLDSLLSGEDFDVNKNDRDKGNVMIEALAYNFKRSIGPLINEHLIGIDSISAKIDSSNLLPKLGLNSMPALLRTVGIRAKTASVGEELASVVTSSINSNPLAAAAASFYKLVVEETQETFPVRQGQFLALGLGATVGLDILADVGLSYSYGPMGFSVDLVDKFSDVEVMNLLKVAVTILLESEISPSATSGMYGTDDFLDLLTRLVGTDGLGDNLKFDTSDALVGPFGALFSIIALDYYFKRTFEQQGHPIANELTSKVRSIAAAPNMSTDPLSNSITGAFHMYDGLIVAAKTLVQIALERLSVYSGTVIALNGFGITPSSNHTSNLRIPKSGFTSRMVRSLKRIDESVVKREELIAKDSSRNLFNYATFEYAKKVTAIVPMLELQADLAFPNRILRSTSAATMLIDPTSGTRMRFVAAVGPDENVEVLVNQLNRLVALEESRGRGYVHHEWFETITKVFFSLAETTSFFLDPRFVKLLLSRVLKDGIMPEETYETHLIQKGFYTEYTWYKPEEVRLHFGYSNVTTLDPTIKTIFEEKGFDNFDKPIRVVVPEIKNLNVYKIGRPTAWVSIGSAYAAWIGRDLVPADEMWVVTTPFSAVQHEKVFDLRPFERSKAAVTEDSVGDVIVKKQPTKPRIPRKPADGDDKQ